jgi:hypothetical protein
MAYKALSCGLVHEYCVPPNCMSSVRLTTEPTHKMKPSTSKSRRSCLTDFPSRRLSGSLMELPRRASNTAAAPRGKVDPEAPTPRQTCCQCTAQHRASRLCRADEDGETGSHYGSPSKRHNIRDDDEGADKSSRNAGAGERAAKNHGRGSGSMCADQSTEFEYDKSPKKDEFRWECFVNLRPCHLAA